MSSRSKILIFIKETGSYIWVEIDKTGTVIDRRVLDALAEVPIIKKHPTVTVLLPGQKVFLQKIKMPKTNRKNRLKALDYILEDKIITAVRDMHRCVVRYKKNYFVAAIDKKWWSHILEQLSALPYNVSCVIPDYLAIPYDGCNGTVKIEGSCPLATAIVRTGQLEGFVVPVAYLECATQKVLNPASVVHIAEGRYDPDLNKSKLNFLHSKEKNKKNMRNMRAAIWGSVLLCFGILWGQHCGLFSVSSSLPFVRTPVQQFIYLLDQVGVCINASPGVAVKKLEYANGRLIVAVETPTEQSFLSFKDRIALVLKAEKILYKKSHARGSSASFSMMSAIQRSLESCHLWKYATKIDQFTISFSDVPFDPWILWLENVGKRYNDFDFSVKLSRGTVEGTVQVLFTFS